MAQKTIKERLLVEFDRPSDEPFDSHKIATKLFYPENLNLVFNACTDNDTHNDIMPFDDETIRVSSRQEPMDMDTNNTNGNGNSESEAMDTS